MKSDAHLLRAARHALGLTLAGDASRAIDLDARLATSPHPTARAWRLSLSLARHLLSGKLDAPAIDEVFAAVAACAETDACERLLELAERSALLDGRRDDLDALLQLHAARLGSTVSLRVAEYMRDVVCTGSAAPDLGTALAEEARRLRSPIYMEVIAFRSLQALNEGRLEDADRDARRALLMARTEGSRLHHYLASLTMARVRRYRGKLHLANRTLTALAPRVAPPWRPWLEWECFLAGQVAGENICSGAAAAASVALCALTAGDYAGFDRAVEHCRRCLTPFRMFVPELEALAQLLDARRPAEQLEAEVAAFCRGDTDAIPRGLSAFATAGDATTAVLLLRETAPRRVLGAGATAARARLGFRSLGRTRMRQGRVDTALALLALAADGGIDEARLFEQVYGFPFDEAIHGKVASVLLVRVRERVSPLASVRRVRRRDLQLVPEGGLLIEDPRVAENVESRVLATLVCVEGFFVCEIAVRLGTSVRTIQGAVQQLVRSGDCQMDRNGRRVVYALVDNTYSRPTQNQS